jgi:hypothetical protein
MDPQNIYKKSPDMAEQVRDAFGIRQDAGVPEDVVKYAWPAKPHSGRAMGQSKGQTKSQSKSGRGRGRVGGRVRGSKKAFGAWGGFD